MAKTPPSMITAKDRLYIEDLLNQTLVFNKKTKIYDSMATDSQTKNKLTEISKMLAFHYDELLKILQTQSKGGSSSGKK